MEEKDLKKSNNDNANYKKRINQPRQQRNIPQKNQGKNIFLSVVVPLYNEEESLPELILQIESEVKNIPQARNSYEVIFVDDGSKDRSFEVIKTIRNRNQNVRGIRFRRNYGKSAALAVGFEKARGQFVATMDADLQDDPAELPKMLEKINEGYDLVSGWKKKRHDPITKTIPSKFFNFVTSCVSGLKLHDFNCGLKLYRRDVVKYLQVYGEMHRYLPVLAKWGGFKVTEVPVTHHPRRYGKSKFGFSRFMKGFLDLLTVWFTNRYLIRPLHFFGTLGTLVALSGFGINIYLTIEWFLGKTYLTNRPLALFGIALIIVGVQLVSMGLLGEMIAKNTLEQQNYNIKEKI
ncbi:glycosyltransferase [Bacteroidetes/Chlorobi group bacterium ChocPot_Mid]|jgi:glycosyltransferase involved in cell wall biosynthesis|nr:MAG: glycosyltransferase [Bacteroidetes/Chlorobi group bacterium ChocPot_Mid]